MDEKRKKIIAITVCVLFVIAVFSLGWVLSRHYSDLESSNGNDVRTTVRNSQKSVDRISDSNDELSRLNAEDQNAIERAEQVFDDVDRANQ